MHTNNDSLHFYAWISHADCIFYAACENNKLLETVSSEPAESEHFIDRQLSLFYSTGLLFGVSIELIFKARILFEKKLEIEMGAIKEFSDVTKEWKGNGHEILKLIDQYGISINSDSKLFIQTLQPFMVWAGRFPYPKKQEEIKRIEKGELLLQLPGRIKSRVQEIINEQRGIMGAPNITI